MPCPRIPRLEKMIAIVIVAFIQIAWISFLRLSTPAEKPYNTKGLGSKYQGQREPTASRYYLHFWDDKP
jgi:dCTP deaminase